MVVPQFVVVPKKLYRCGGSVGTANPLFTAVRFHSHVRDHVKPFQLIFDQAGGGVVGDESRALPQVIQGYPTLAVALALAVENLDFVEPGRLGIRTPRTLLLGAVVPPPPRLADAARDLGRVPV